MMLKLIVISGSQVTLAGTNLATEKYMCMQHRAHEGPEMPTTRVRDEKARHVLIYVRKLPGHHGLIRGARI